MVYPVPIHLTFVAVAALGAASDVANRRIPNWVSVPLLAGGIAAQAALGSWSALSAAAAAIVLGSALLPLWIARKIGGGDLKLAAAAAAWVGLPGLLRYLVVSALAAGALALVSYATSHAEARAAIRMNFKALGHGLAVAPPLGAVGGRAPVAAGAAFAFGAAWVLAGG